jgi:hypothetical protein
VRYDVEYIGQYRGSKRAMQVLRNFGSSTAVVVDWTLFNMFGSVGIRLDPVKDNKSVWSPEWIKKGLEKFGTRISPALEAWELGSWNPREWASDTRTGKRSDGGSASGEERRFGSGSGTSSSSTASPMGRGAFSAAGGNRRSANTGRHLPDSERALLPGTVAGSLHQNSSGGSWEPEVYEHAKSATLAAAGAKFRRFTPLQYDVVCEEVVHANHFSGLPDLTRNRDALPCALRGVLRIANGDRAFQPYSAGRRVQHGVDGPKGRLIWMAPLTTTIVASSFSKPIYEGLKAIPTFSYGWRKQEIGGKLSELQARFDYVYSLDFSGFDARIPAFMLNDAFQILKTWLELSVEQEAVFNRVVHDFIHSRIVLPDGSMWQVHRGVPSGNPFTSLVDSVVNLLTLNYMWIRATGIGVKPGHAMILGDDSVFGTNQRVDLDTLASYAAELGMLVNVDKSKVATRDSAVEYLGHSWRNSRPHRPFHDIIIRMAFPERHQRRSTSDSLVRFISYAADSEEFVDVFYAVRKTYGSYLDMVRALLLEIEVDEITFDQGPGYLRYLETIEPNMLKDLRRGLKLAAIGILS